MNAPAPLHPAGPAHAVYAPSSAHRWLLCTASASAIAALPPAEEGEEAAKGTRAHDEIERILGHLSETIAAPVDIERAVTKLDPAHPSAYGIALVLDFVRQLPEGTLWVEQRVRLTDEIWGRCDVGHWDDSTSVLTIVDYKDGYVNVEAEDNEQLEIYGASTIMTRKLPAKWVRLVVVQPNSFMPVPRVKQWIVSAADLYAFAERAAAVPHGPLTFTAGEQCKYCPLFGRCPASQDVLARLAAVLCNPPDGVPAGQYAIFKAMEKPISDWFKGADKDQTKKALSGHVAPGMKLVETTTKRVWKDEAAARAAVVAKCGVAALDPPTPAQAEKLGIDISILADKPKGAPALAFESDKRPDWKEKSAAEMFGAVTGKEATK